MNRVAGVSYQNSGFILVSEYSHNEPSLAEFTAAQALVMPVIDDGAHIYVLDANAAGSVAVAPDSLEFAAKGGTKKVSVDANTFSATSSAAWASVTPGTKSFKVTAAANTGAARNAVITITDGAESSPATLAIVTVEQEAGE